ncbi:MAG: hypothetical protein HY726_17550 [Candidatus Rokubacteria bacterium]|nr:hypothetical protein [Candidatus Rokubacteria bacterium]
MKTTKQPQELFGAVTGTAVEALSLWTDANQKILRELADLTGSTVKEGVRLYAELQSSAVEAAKQGQSYWLTRQSELGEWQKHPFVWYQKTVLDGIEGTQKAFKLVEGNALALTRSAERLQATAEQAAREIQQTFAGLATQLKAIYTPSDN